MYFTEFVVHKNAKKDRLECQIYFSEDELKALSEGVADGTIPVDTGYNTRTKVKKHDLASEDSTLGVNLSSIEMINERFIRLFRLGLVEVPKINPKM